MKKILTIISVLALMALGSSAFAEVDFAIDFGPGFSNYDYGDGGETVGANRFGFTFLKTTQSNVAWKIHGEFFSVQAPSMFPKTSDSDDLCFSFTFGLGGVLLKNEKMTFTFMPIVGFELIDGGSIKTESDDHLSKTKIGGGLLGFTTGVDFTGIYRFTKHIAVFSNVGLYYTIGSFEYDNYKETRTDTKSDWTRVGINKDYSVRGWTFAPSIGVSLSFGN